MNHSGGVIDLKDFQNNYDFERFKFQPCAAQSNALALATDHYLMIANLTASSSSEPSKTTIKFNKYEDDRISVTVWLEENIIVCGFESGLVQGFDQYGQFVFQFNGPQSSVSSVKTTIEGRDIVLWILFENALLVGALFNQALQNNFSEAFGFQCKNITNAHDFILYSYVEPAANIFEAYDLEMVANTTQKRLMVVGGQVAMSIFNLDFAAILAEDRRKVKAQSSTTSSITRSIFSMVQSITGSDATAKDKPENVLSKKRIRELTSVSQFVDDKRRIIRVSLDPLSTLAACADGLGRVTLFDLQTEVAIRIWKGVRDAHLGWIIEPHTVSSPVPPTSRRGSSGRASFVASNTNSNNGSRRASTEEDAQSLRLAIFAPQLGLISIYQMRNGPCLRVIPVGMNGKLIKLAVPTFHDNRNSVETVVPLRCESESKCIEVLSLASTAQSESDLARLVDEMEHEMERSSIVDRAAAGSGDEGAASASNNGIYSDMQSSIQEAMRLQRLSKTPDLAAQLELSRLLKVFYQKSTQNLQQHQQQTSQLSSPVPSSSSPAVGIKGATSGLLPAAAALWSYQDEAIGKVEQGILRVLSRLSLRNLVRFVRVLDVCEITGFHALNHQAHIADNLLLLLDLPQVEGIDSPVMFSLSYHQRLLDILQSAVTKENNTKTSRSNSVSSTTSNDNNNSNVEDPASSSSKLARSSSVASTELLVQLEQELKQRKILLDLYSKCADLSKQVTKEILPRHAPVLSSSVQEEAASICRQVSHRAEALCWTMRAYKLQEKELLHHVQQPQKSLSYMSPASASSATTSPLRGHPSTSPTLNGAASAISSPNVNSSNNNSGVSPLSPTSRKVSALREKISRYSTNTDVSPLLRKTVATHAINQGNGNGSSGSNDSTDNQPKAPLGSPSQRRQQQLLQQQQLDALYNKCPVSFPAFAQYFEVTSTGVPVFQSQLMLLPSVSVSSQDSEHHHHQNHHLAPRDLFLLGARAPVSWLSVPSANHTTNVSGTATSAENSSQGHLPKLVIHLSLQKKIRELLLTPLLGDLVSLHAFSSTLKKLDPELADPGAAILLLLEQFFHFMQPLPAGCLVADLLVKKSHATTPLQRWLRDHLLTFQVTLTEFHQQAGALDGNEEGTHSNKMFQHLEQLTQDILHEHSFYHPPQRNSTGSHPDDLRQSFELLQLAQANTANEAPVVLVFDDYVRHLFLPTLHSCRKSTHLEAVLTLSALILETLQGVNDQIERRTYGADNVHSSIAAFENLVRQVRVLLLLQGRALASGLSCPPFTVYNLETGVLSVYRLLAQDSLEFGLRAPMAIEHEDRCREVYLARKQQQMQQQSSSISTMSVSDFDEATNLGMNSSANNNKAEALLAWGKVADKRWRDILSIVLSDDTTASPVSSVSGSKQAEGYRQSANNSASTSPIDTSGSRASGRTKQVDNTNPNSNASNSSSSNASNNKTLKRKRKPLLLYFPQHNHPILLGVYRSLLQAEYWSRRVHQMEHLAVVCEHLFEVLTPWRGIVAYEIYTSCVYPVLQLLLQFEEEIFERGSQNTSNITSNHAVLKNKATRNSPTGTGAGGASRSHKKMTPAESLRAQQLMVIMKEPALVRSFVSLTVEILNYVLENYPLSQLKGVEMPVTDTAIDHLDAVDMAVRQSSSSVGSLPPSLSLATSPPSSLQLPQHQQQQQFAARQGHNGTASTAQGVAGASPSAQQTTSSSQPLQRIPSVFTTQLQRERQRQASSTTVITDELLAQAHSLWPPLHDSALHRWQEQLAVLPLSADLIHVQIATAYMLLLRFQCALRGVRPSLLLGGTSLYSSSLCGITHGGNLLHTILLDHASFQHNLVLKSRLSTVLLHNDHLTDDQVQCRTEFLDLSSKRLVRISSHSSGSNSQNVATSPSGVQSLLTLFYQLGGLWGFPPDILRLLHLQALLEVGDAENEVEGMLSQFEDLSVCMDALLTYARLQLGRLLLYVERLPQYGPVLAAMDAEALLWAKQAALQERQLLLQLQQQQQQQKQSNDSNQPESSRARIQSTAASSSSSTAGGDSTTTSSSTSTASFTFADITITRRVVIYVQSLLSGVPLKDRGSGNNNSTGSNNDGSPVAYYGDWGRRYTRMMSSGSVMGSAGLSSSSSTQGTPNNTSKGIFPTSSISSGGSGGTGRKIVSVDRGQGAGAGSLHGGGGYSILQMTVYGQWIERKSRCDALLSLCNAIVQAALRLQQQQQQSLATSRK